MKKTLLALSLAALSQGAWADNVLVVLSDKGHLDLQGKEVFQTGFYLNELMQPVKRLREAGHKVTFATPTGLAPTLDQSSDNVMYFGGDEKARADHKKLLADLKLTDPKNSPVISLSRVEQIGFKNFDAVYIPGGHAPMQDLLKDQRLGALLREFHAENKTTALVCHGPIALLSALPDAESYVTRLEKGEKPAPSSDWAYTGYKMTVISNQEEEIAKKALLAGRDMKFYPQTGLIAAGGTYVQNKSPWAPNMIIDRELITGQNPASANDVATELLKRLN